MFLLRLIWAVVRALFAKRADLVGDAALLSSSRGVEQLMGHSPLQPPVSREIGQYGLESSPQLQRDWAEIGQLMMDKDSELHKDLIADIHVAEIPLDPRYIDRFI